MARIRTIKPDFWTDEKVVELSAFARLLFIGLWNFADDEGRMVYSEKKIKMQIFPSDDLNISELFGEIRGKKMVTVYKSDNIEYLQIVGFPKHQKIDKRNKSKLPPNSFVHPESPRITTTEGIKEKDQGREKKEETNGSCEPLFVDFKKNLFTDGLKLIGGESKRSMLGKWVSEYGEAGVISALIACQKASPIEPIAYIIKTLSAMGKAKTATATERDRQARTGAITL